MNAFLAIVQDTWRQSRQQVVFIVMLVLLAVTAAIGIALPHPFEQADGSHRIALVFQEEFDPSLEEAWLGLYSETLVQERMAGRDPLDEVDLEEWLRVREEAFTAAEARVTLPRERRAVEVILFSLAGVVFTIGTLAFIAASSGYFPNLLEAGAIDLVLSKPVDRLQIFLGKYVGGLALYTAALTATYVLLFVGVGLHTGVYVVRVFYVLPLSVFAAAVLFAIIAALGVRTRSATLCLVVGLVFYIVVDSAIGGFVGAEQAGLLEAWPWAKGAARVLRWTLPNFSLLKQGATAAVLDIPYTFGQPFVVAGAWLVGALAYGYWRFWRAEF